jgi:uroporphyrinogen decarboxylase
MTDQVYSAEDRDSADTMVMTSVQRVLAVLRHEQPDRVPHFEWSHAARTVAELTDCGSYFDLIDRLDIDAVIVAPAYRREPLEGGMFRDEWGAVRQIGADNYARVVEEHVPLRTEADLARWQVPDPDDPYRYEPLRQVVARFGGQRAIIFQARDVWSPVRDFMGYAEALVGLIERPAMVEEVVARCVDHYSQVIRHAARLGANIIMTGDDICDGRGPLFSPRHWHRIFLPHYRRLVTAVHDAGLYHWKHSDGNLYPLLQSIVEAGTDGIDPVDPLGGMHLAEVKARYGDRVAIKGNIDQLNLLVDGPAEAVEEAVRICVRDAGTRGGYVCSSSNSIHSGVDPQLYSVMVDAIHRYGRYLL